jgi:hypothetical protein
MALAVVLSQAFRGATTRPTIAEASLRAELANEPGLLWGVANDLRLLRTPLAWRVWASLAVSVSVPFLARAVGLSSAAVTDITLRVATLVCFGQLLRVMIMTLCVGNDPPVSGGRMVEAPGWTPARDGTRVSVVGRKVMFGPDGWMYDWCGVYAELSFEGTGLQLQMRGSHNVFQLWLCPNQTPRAPETDPRAALWAALARHDCRDQPALPRPSGCWGRLTGSARERWREVAGAGAGGLRQRVLSTGHWETNATTYTVAEGLPWGRYSVRIAKRTGFDGNLYGCVTLTAARALGQAAAGAAADGRQPSLLQLASRGAVRLEVRL